MSIQNLKCVNYFAFTKNILEFKMASSLMGFTLVFILFSCSHKEDSKHYLSPALLPKSTNELSIMAYNVENLFDNIKDPGTIGEMNLDWSHDQIQAKITNLSQVILSVDQGAGPDVLMLEEVENNRILTQLNQEGLHGFYQTQVLIEGFDPRGIDVALLSKLPLDGTPELLRISFQPKTEQDRIGQSKTRGILKVPLRLPNKQRLTVFVVHFPSQAHPSYWREQAAQFLANQFKSAGPHELMIAGGDFNTVESRENEGTFYRNILSEVGTVSHHVGCRTCSGTHNYKGEWSFLDALVFSHSFSNKKSGWTFDPSTIDAIKLATEQTKSNGAPNSFEESNLKGYSDHLPIYGRIRFQ